MKNVRYALSRTFNLIHSNANLPDEEVPRFREHSGQTYISSELLKSDTNVVFIMQMEREIFHLDDDRL